MFSLEPDDETIAVQPSRPIVVSRRWKYAKGTGIAKSFEFNTLAKRNLFVTQCVSHENNFPTVRVTWTISGLRVDVLVEDTAVGLTEDAVQLAKSVDSRHEEITSNTYSLDDDVEHFYGF